MYNTAKTAFSRELVASEKLSYIVIKGFMSFIMFVVV
jgi:hypothetical protein